jgi:hypothetical protein
LLDTDFDFLHLPTLHIELEAAEYDQIIAIPTPRWYQATQGLGMQGWAAFDRCKDLFARDETVECERVDSPPWHGLEYTSEGIRRK